MSDKARLKRCKKDAELSRNAIDKLKHGERFYNSFQWGLDLADILLSIEKRLRDAETQITDTEWTRIKKLNSDAMIQITSEQIINSGAVIRATIEQTIDSNTFIGQETQRTVSSDTFVGQETEQTITSDTEIS